MPANSTTTTSHGVQPQTLTLRSVAHGLERLAQDNAGELPVALRELLMAYSKAVLDAEGKLKRANDAARPIDGDAGGQLLLDLTNVHALYYDEKSLGLTLMLQVNGERRWRAMTVPASDLAGLLGDTLAKELLASDGRSEGVQHHLAVVQSRLSPVMESVFQFTVLHDRPLDESPSLKDLAYEIYEGGFVGGDVQRLSLRKLSPGQLDTMAKHLGSEAAFFGSCDETFESLRIARLCDTAFEARAEGKEHANPCNIEEDYDGYRAYEMGWYQGLSEGEFVALMEEETNLQMSHAQGQDLDWHPLRMKVIDDIIEAGPWKWDMDSARAMRKDAVIERPRG